MLPIVDIQPDSFEQCTKSEGLKLICIAICMKYYVSAALNLEFSSQQVAWMNCIMGYIHCVKDCYYLSFLMAYTKMAIVSGLIISVNKVSGSDRVHCCVCVWKAEAIVTGHRSFNLELANYFFQHVCFAHPEETVELFFCAGCVFEYALLQEKKQIKSWLSA